MNIENTYVGIKKPIPYTIKDLADEALSLIEGKTEQELYFPQEEQEEEIEEEETDTYTVVSDTAGKNPNALGWYEKNGNDEYVLTSDEKPVENKVYYTKD